jgi:hypothetical protein
VRSEIPSVSPSGGTDKDDPSDSEDEEEERSLYARSFNDTQFEEFIPECSKIAIQEGGQVWENMRRASIEVVFNYTRNQGWRNI